jgi:hypothetical protein
LADHCLIPKHYERLDSFARHEPRFVVSLTQKIKQIFDDSYVLLVTVDSNSGRRFIIVIIFRS